MARGLSSFTDSTITVVYGGTYTGDGINGWTGGTSVQFAVKGRRTPLNRPDEDTTDSGFGDATPGPITYGVFLEGFFKNLTGASGAPTIPPINLTDAFIKVTVTIGFGLVAVILVKTFEPSGVIGTALNYRLEGRTVGTCTYS